MRSVVLSGPMGAGKSTLGPLVADRLSLPFLDLDAEIVRESGTPIETLFRTEGETSFRRREQDVALRLLADDAPARVIAFGGGAVTSSKVRKRALERAFVVTLTAGEETLLARASGGGPRPLLEGADPRARLEELLRQRRAAYAECHLSLNTEGADFDFLVESVAALVQRAPVVMPLGERTYAIDICHKEPTRLTDALARLAPSSIVLVTDAHVRRARAAEVEAALHPLAIPVVPVVLPAGEVHKTLSSVGAIWDAALGAAIDRDSVVLAAGGGVVGDLAGFAAATLLRGIRVVQVPTTLLAMVDASVGGKTAFDHPAGKNLIGAFHQPAAVVADLDHLTTLPPRERIAGMAEIVKVAFVADAPLFERIEAESAKLAQGASEALLPVVRSAILAKARIVEEDETERGVRALLNFGHTIGHALEAHGGYARFLHGEAVAVGMVVELDAAIRLGLAPALLAPRLRDVLVRLGLPVEARPGEVRAAFPFVGLDKKRSRGAVGFAAFEGVGRATLAKVRLTDLQRVSAAA